MSEASTAASKPVPTLPDKNTPLERHVGFEVKGEPTPTSETRARRDSIDNAAAAEASSAPAPGAHAFALFFTTFCLIR
jgi:hypothetical protein